jgi:putative tryptophan/tyrosine transport system substrate-binding protein
MTTDDVRDQHDHITALDDFTWTDEATREIETSKPFVVSSFCFGDGPGPYSRRTLISWPPKWVCMTPYLIWPFRISSDGDPTCGGSPRAICSMNRRNFLIVVGGLVTTSWVPAAPAQQVRVPTVGVLLVESPGSEQFRLQLREELRKLGYVDGRSIRFEFRSDLGKGSRLPELAAELVRLKVDIIVTWFTPAARAAKEATREIPIVIGLAGNPVETGLIDSLARPGGNITGISGVGAELAGKCAELLAEILPWSRRAVALCNASDPFWKPFLEKVRLGGKATGIKIDPMMINGPDGLEPAFATMAQDRPDAVIVQPSLGPKRPTELALKYRIPAVSFFREFAEEGGLFSYSSVDADIYRRAAMFVDKILKGAKPAELPVEQPTKFELVINLKTAKSLGLTIPPSQLLRADDVIE